MPRRFTLPDSPPSARLLPEHERRERAQDLKWMHEAAAPRRKKRVDPMPDNMDELMRRAFGNAFEEDD